MKKETVGATTATPPTIQNPVANTATSAKEKLPVAGARKSISISTKLYPEPDKKQVSIAAESLPSIYEKFSPEDLQNAWNDFFAHRGRADLHVHDGCGLGGGKAAE